MNRVFLNESTSNLGIGHLASGRKKAFVQITTLEKEIGGILIAVFPFSVSAVVSNLPGASQPPFLLPPH